MKKTDFGFREVTVQEKQKLVNQVFDSVFNRYDVMNDVMSLGIHRLWKRHAIACCQIRSHHQVLDLACGSGDLSLLIAPKLTSGLLISCDINKNMLKQAQQRLLDRGLIPSFLQADAQDLPFAPHTFDRIIMGFGLRNVSDKEKALKSICQVMKAGARVIILEFSHPTNAALSSLYDAYSFHILPLLGEWIAQDRDSYRYLVESIRRHPNQETLKALMLNCGFDKVQYQNLAGGIVAIHQGIKY